MTLTRKLIRLTQVTIIMGALAGCSAITRLSEVGDGPKLSEITNPTATRDYRPVSMPMPAPRIVEDNPNSLWRAGARAFFKDQRAKEVGDILTITLDLDDSASMENSTERERDDSETTSVTTLFGLEAEFSKVLPQGVNNGGNLIAFDGAHETKGDGSIGRSETIELTFAAVVTQVLPNGSLAIMGRQEIRVNSELRELMVSGIIRPEDIESDNSITHEKIVEMRVAYGGRGSLSDLQRPHWGTQIWDIIFPF